eukprot:gene38789-52394_t
MKQRQGNQGPERAADRDQECRCGAGRPPVCMVGSLKVGLHATHGIESGGLRLCGLRPWRRTDRRGARRRRVCGGANGGRLRLAPQKGWAVNDPAEVSKVVAKLETVRAAFNKGAKGGRQREEGVEAVRIGRFGIV